MCLYSYNDTATRAKKCIVTYKSVTESAYSKNHCTFFSAFRNFMYEEGKLYREPRFEREAEFKMVSKGFHSHANIAEAEDECQDSRFPATMVLRCEIPRGAYYYKGKSRMGEDLCSDFLVVTGWKDPDEDKWHDAPHRESRLAVRLAVLKARLQEWRRGR